MHELSLCGSIEAVVRKHAGQRPVDTIYLRVGQLRQVVPDTLVHCWALVTAETALDGSLLEIESVPARVRCRSCEAEGLMGAVANFACAACGSVTVQVLAGEEFLITAMDVR
ncbi:MAG: hydrogenase maturation nickel metallochaperone HypA [Jatrophihabitans sp.]